MRTQVAPTHKITKVVITRSRKGNVQLARKLKALGYEPIPIDTIEFLPPEDWSEVDAGLNRLSEFDWVLFTSGVGAKFFARRMRALSLALPWHGKPAVAAVGERTSAALEREGIKVDFVPTAYLTSALAEELPRERGKDLLILRAEIGNPDVVVALERDGFRVSDVSIYTTSDAPGNGDEAKEAAVMGADAIVFASPSAVEAFMRRFGSGQTASFLTKRLLALCIGPVTARAAKDHGFKRILAPGTHTIESVVQELGRAATGSGRD